jgi:quinol monooxygenase YgiN
MAGAFVKKTKCVCAITHQKTGDEAMIITTISFRAAPGKNLEAVEYLQKLARDVKKLNGADVRVATQLAGPTGHFILSSQYETVSKWDEARQKVASDASIQKQIVEAAKSDLFLPGTTTSALWQEI